nr:DUF2339 domain-containing protein [Alkalilimnicola ehrlichii]
MAAVGRSELGLVACAWLHGARSVVAAGGGASFCRLGVLAWGAAFAVQYRLLYLGQLGALHAGLPVWHQLTLTLAAVLSAWSLAWVASSWWPSGGEAAWLAWGAVPSLLVAGLLLKGERLYWPVQVYPQVYRGDGLLPFVGFIALWNLAACSLPVQPVGLPYLPLLNPLELVQALSLLLLAYWLRGLSRWPSRAIRLPEAWLQLGFGALVLVVFSTVLARAVHHWQDVEYALGALFGSMVFQTSVSILWTLMALGLMTYAQRRAERVLWFCGAALLGLVVVKLFLIDLAGSGTLARIVSFVAVGGLMLLIGYLAPLPPRDGGHSQQPVAEGS